MNKKKIGYMCLTLAIGFFGALLFLYVKKEQEIVRADSTTIIINEVCCKNMSVVSIGKDDYPRSFIELYNAGTESVNLKGYVLTDDLQNKDGRKLPDKMLEPKDYCLFFVDEKIDGELYEEKEMILDFSIESASCSLYLLNENGLLIDRIDVPNITVNESYGRCDIDDIPYSAQTCTPYADNNGAQIVEIASFEGPEFSVESGFYKEAFMLEMWSEEGDVIYYTLDGTEPSRNSIKYEGSIYVTDASANPNNWSARTDFSLMEYYIPEELVDKATIIKAAAWDVLGNRSETKLATYFINGDDNNLYEKYVGNIPVISVVAEPEDLFGYEEGILVLGKKYDEWVAELGAEPEDKRDFKIGANFSQEGRKGERMCQISYFENGSQSFQQEVGIHRRGASSSTGRQKGFNIVARTMYAGNNGRIVYDLFNTGNNPKTLTLKRCVGFPKERLAYELIKSETHMLPINWQFVTLFVNGEYWGLYNMYERCNPDFFEIHYGLEEESIAVIKSGGLAYGDTSDSEEWQQIIEYAKNYDLSQEANYKYICSKIDIKNYIDYYLFQIYNDAYDVKERYNVTIWKSKENNRSNIYGDGRWRWMLYDEDSCMSDYKRNNITEDIREGRIAYFKHDLLSALLKNEDFAELFVARYVELVENEYAYANMNRVINDLIVGLDNPLNMQMNNYNNTSYALKAATKDIKEFYEMREEYVTKYLKEYFATTEFEECKKMLANIGEIK